MKRSMTRWIFKTGALGRREENIKEKIFTFSDSVVRVSLRYQMPQNWSLKNTSHYGVPQIFPLSDRLHFVTVLMLMTLVTWTKGDQSSRVILATCDIFLHFLFLQYLGNILPSNGDSSPLIGKHILCIVTTSDPTSLSTGWSKSPSAPDDYNTESYK
jgi:hypothetical protein